MSGKVVDLEEHRRRREAAMEACWTCHWCGCQHMIVLQTGVECGECGARWGWEVVAPALLDED